MNIEGRARLAPGLLGAGLVVSREVENPEGPVNGSRRQGQISRPISCAWGGELGCSSQRVPYHRFSKSGRAIGFEI